MNPMTDTMGRGSTFRPQMGFGDYLRKARRDFSNYGQQQMADALGVTVQAYSSWESGRAKPRDVAKVARQLEKITNVDREWFLGWGNEATSDYKSDVSAPKTSRKAGLRPRGRNDQRASPARTLGR
jgi:transcriptional regulator with XRE-family HTH domain